MSHLNNIFDLETLAQELRWTELPDEIEDGSPARDRWKVIGLLYTNRTAIRCGAEQRV